MFDDPPVISPVVASIEAASVGATLNVNIPPVRPVTLTLPPSHKGVKMNEASSSERAEIDSVSLEEQTPKVVYNIS